MPLGGHAVGFGEGLGGRISDGGWMLLKAES